MPREGAGRQEEHGRGRQGEVVLARVAAGRGRGPLAHVWPQGCCSAAVCPTPSLGLGRVSQVCAFDSLPVAV